MALAARLIQAEHLPLEPSLRRQPSRVPVGQLELSEPAERALALNSLAGRDRSLLLTFIDRFLLSPSPTLRAWWNLEGATPLESNFFTAAHRSLMSNLQRWFQPDTLLPLPLGWSSLSSDL